MKNIRQSVRAERQIEGNNDPSCTNIGFSISALPKEGGYWREGTT